MTGKEGIPTVRDCSSCIWSHCETIKNKQIINSVLSTSCTGNPSRSVRENQAYQFLLIGQALVLSLWLCHLKPRCCLADGIRPFTQGLNRSNRLDWKKWSLVRGGSWSHHPPLAWLLSLRQTSPSRCWGSLQSAAAERSLPNWQRLHGGNVHLLPVCTN